MKDAPKVDKERKPQQAPKVSQEQKTAEFVKENLESNTQIKKEKHPM